MKQTLLLILLSVFTLSSFAQEPLRKSAHQQQLEEFGHLKSTKNFKDFSKTPIIPLSARSTNTLSKIVFGFLPYWEYSSGAHSNMHYNLLSHIALFNFKASASGVLTNPAGWPWTDVINEAHNNNTKVIMVVNNFTASEIHTILTNTTVKNTLFANIENTINTYQLDGVNIDFEGLDSSDRGSILNAFLLDLTNYIHTNLPGKEVSFDGPAVNWSGWQLNALTQNVDYVFIMAYDYNGSWSNNTGAVAPLTHPSGGICVTKSLDNDYSLPISNYPEKLILGVPYYGKHWKTSADYAGAPVTSYVGSTFYRDTANNATYGSALWNANSSTSWYKWFASGWNQIWADNDQSIGLKYDKAIEKNLGGVGIWALNYDGNRSELWDLINTKFNASAGVNEESLGNTTIYPNPVKNRLSIQNKQNSSFKSYQVYTLLGQKVADGSIKNNQISVEKLKKGIYFIKVKDLKNNIITRKFIKE